MQSSIASSSEDRSPQPQRLPVNPRRHKVAPEHRKRVVRACNACNVRRVRCSGEQPCQRCRKVSRECEYPAPESDKNALKSEIERLQKRCAALEQTLQVELPDEAADLIRQLNQGEPVARSSTSTFQFALPEIDAAGTGAEAEAEAEPTEGRLLLDPDGTMRYLGETSGATFLDYLKQFMLTLVPLTFQPDSGDGSSFVVSIGQYQTFDSRPLPNPDVDPLWLPSREDMALMLEELRYYIQDGNGEFPSGGIYWWGDLSNAPLPPANSTSLSTMTTEDTFRHLAFHHVCFALASSVGPTSFRRSEKHTGEAYFKRARLLIGNPLDTVRFTLTDVPVLALMGFYLIELNRRDAAYMYVSLAVHIAIIHGAFKSCEDEASRRTYWTLYILDRWLSVLMGRPPTIADGAIRIPLPGDNPSLPPSAGLRAHVELARISGYIVCETFKIAPRQNKPGYSIKNIDKALEELETWKAQLPPALTLSPLQIDPDPACCTLHMAQNQLIVLTTRPIFLAAVKHAVAERFMGGHWSVEQHSQKRYLQACSNAAHQNMIFARSIRLSRKLLQAGLHFVFNAAVILLLDRILYGNQIQHVEVQGGHAIPTPLADNLHGPEIQFAIQVFEQESRTGTNYPRDCCRVLQDLKALVDRYLSQSHVSSIPRNLADDSHNIRSAQNAGEQSHGAPSSQPAVAEDGLYREMMTWVQSDGLQLRNSLLI